jgi:hypothetical protein
MAEMLYSRQQHQALGTNRPNLKTTNYHHLTCTIKPTFIKIHKFKFKTIFPYTVTKCNSKININLTIN